MIYRESVGDSQQKDQIAEEVSKFEKEVENIRKNKNKPDFKPELIYIMVSKKINTRFFASRGDLLQNPPPGSLMVDSVSSENFIEFHLVPQQVTQGTCTPTLFRIAYYNTKVPLE